MKIKKENTAYLTLKTSAYPIVKAKSKSEIRKLHLESKTHHSKKYNHIG